MMKKRANQSAIWQALAACVALFLASGCTQRAASDVPLEIKPTTAPSYTSAADGFAIWLPGTPKEGIQTGKNPDGGAKITARVIHLSLPTVTYLIVPTAIPPKDARYDPQGFLDTVQQDFLAASGAKLSGSKKLRLNGHSGREITVVIGQNTMRSRIFWTYKRAFQIVASTPKDKVAENRAQIDKVLNSFRILEK